ACACGEAMEVYRRMRLLQSARAVMEMLLGIAPAGIENDEVKVVCVLRRHRRSPRMTRIDANTSKGYSRSICFGTDALRLGKALVLQLGVVAKIYQQAQCEAGCVQVI